MRILCLLLVLLTGCNSLTRTEEKDLAKWMVPVNVAAGYFGAVAWHEAGHALTAEGLGGKDTKVYLLPKKDDDGNWHLGLTTTKFRNPSDLDTTLFNTMGPTSMFLGHIGVRALLRSGQVPRIAQPTLAWFGFCNQVGYYGQVFGGIFRLDKTDLGKEKPWISWVMLAGGLAVDITDIVFDDFDHYFGVLFGEAFYEDEHDQRKIKFISAPLQGGGYLGLELGW